MLFFLESNTTFGQLVRKEYEVEWAGIKFSYSPYTDCTRCVVRASSESEARQIAGELEPWSNKSIWFRYPALSTCEILNPDGNPGIILADIPTG